MADEARKITDRRLKQIEKRVTSIYTQAQDEISKSWNVYMDNVAKKLEKLQQEYDAAKASGDTALIKSIGEKLGKAKASETYQNARYAAMLDNVTSKLANVNQTAISYINGELPSIYVINYNSIAPKAKIAGVKFSLINESTIRRRILDGDITNPFMHLEKFLNIPKDKRWNTKLLNSQIVQGILQGEPVKKIADRIYPIVNHNKDAAIRNARTMVTGAENRGRQESAEKLEELGAVINKTWIATGDSRTRDSHLAMDGETVPLDDKFSNKLMFPGDESGDPSEYYNCRCSLAREIVGVKRPDGTIKDVSIEHEETAHDKEIQAEKERRAEEEREKKKKEK